MRSKKATVEVRNAFFDKHIPAALGLAQKAWKKSLGADCPWESFADVSPSNISTMDEMQLNPHENQPKVLVSRDDANTMNARNQTLARIDTTDGKAAQHVTIALTTRADGKSLSSAAIGGPDGVETSGAAPPFIIKSTGNKDNEKLTVPMTEGMMIDVEAAEGEEGEAGESPDQVPFMGECVVERVDCVVLAVT